jgi:hypothetical protein
MHGQAILPDTDLFRLLRKYEFTNAALKKKKPTKDKIEAKASG